MNGLRILVVDDSISARAFVRTALAAEGATCLEACDGAEALELLESEPVDLVIADHWMPTMTGSELIQAIRSHRHFDELPILAITADADMVADQDLLAAGATACIGKPFSGDDLLACVWETVVS
jgi:CheY-like chemotaxis protein